MSPQQEILIAASPRNGPFSLSPISPTKSTGFVTATGVGQKEA